MLYVTVCLCWVACAVAAPPQEVLPLEKQQPTVIPIVSQSEELEPNGTYKFSYETGNGIKREETSYNKLVPRAEGRSADSNEGGESDSDEIHVQVGSYSYTAPDGTLISVRYIADENGFQPIGDHIPRVPSLASSVSSAEKSGRALNVADNTEASSSPAAKVVPKLEPRIATVPAESKSENNKTDASSEGVKLEGTTETVTSTKTDGTKASEGQSEPSTTEVPNTSTGSTTSPESANTQSSTTDVSKIESPTTDTGKDTSTTEKDVSTTESKTDATTEAKTEASVTTESAATTAAVTTESASTPPVTSV